MSDQIATFFATVFCAIAVKLVDDFLDKEQDNDSGCFNLTTQLGLNSVVYAALFLALAAGLNSKISMPLFLASYIVGMFNTLGHKLPSKLTGLQESILVGLLAILLFGWHRILFALTFITAIQLGDDCVDLRSDHFCGQSNLACRYGLVECFILALSALLLACWLDEEIFLPVLAGSMAVYAGFFYHQRRDRRWF